MKAAGAYQACRCRISGVLITLLLCCEWESTAGQAHAAEIATHEQIGHASWYGPGFHGKKTASGKEYDRAGLTAAHPTLPLGTMVEVTNLSNNKMVDVEITDRGPHDGKRAIDLSEQAAHALSMKENGTARVKIKAKAPASSKAAVPAGARTRSGRPAQQSQSAAHRKH